MFVIFTLVKAATPLLVKAGTLQQMANVAGIVGTVATVADTLLDIKNKLA